MFAIYSPYYGCYLNNDGSWSEWSLKGEVLTRIFDTAQEAKDLINLLGWPESTCLDVYDAYVVDVIRDMAV